MRYRTRLRHLGGPSKISRLDVGEGQVNGRDDPRKITHTWARTPTGWKIIGGMCALVATLRMNTAELIDSMQQSDVTLPVTPRATIAPMSDGFSDNPYVHNARPLRTSGRGDLTVRHRERTRHQCCP